MTDTASWGHMIIGGSDKQSQWRKMDLLNDCMIHPMTGESTMAKEIIKLGAIHLRTTLFNNGSSSRNCDNKLRTTSIGATSI